MIDRAVGALLGLACGDAVGTTLEFRPPGTFAPITDMVGGGPFALMAGEWTDDTSMALCLAESILDTGGHDPGDQLRRFLLWADEGYLASNGRCFDIGRTVRAQLERFRTTGEPSDPSPNPHAAANGSLMRLAAVPIRWHADPEEAVRLSGESSRTTHPAARPVDACRVLGAMISALISGTGADDVLAPDFWQWGSLDPEIGAVTGGSWRRREPPEIRGSGYCVDALEAALWAVAGAETFEQAVLRAANLGDDADTTAAIAGQLAGARWGASGIPQRWRRQVVAPDRIESLAHGLFVAGGGQPESQRWPHDGFIHAWRVSDRVLAGEFPGHPHRSRAREKVNLLVDSGIRTFVDLTTPEDHLEPYQPMLDEAAGHRQLDLRRVSFPIPDNHVAPDDLYDRALHEVEAASSRGGVYIHCWGGVGRTGTVVACLMGQKGGWGYDETMVRLRQARAGSRKSHRPCPETDVQRRFLMRRLGGSL